jgi:catechol 2,3-dioxygenase-like lactoylglutathione lyase family enzyme
VALCSEAIVIPLPDHRPCIYGIRLRHARWTATTRRAVGVSIVDADMDILFVGPIAVIAPDPAESRKLYLDALGLPLAAGEGSDYWHTEQLPGTKHFAIWPLREAAQACFGQPTWPDDRPVPQASIEFEVGDPPAVGAAAEELHERGFVLLHGAREEPWGQIVARLLSPEGLIVGLSYAPGLRDQDESTGA